MNAPTGVAELIEEADDLVQIGIRGRTKADLVDLITKFRDLLRTSTEQQAVAVEALARFARLSLVISSSVHFADKAYTAEVCQALRAARDISDQAALLQLQPNTGEAG